MGKFYIMGCLCVNKVFIVGMVFLVFFVGFVRFAINNIPIGHSSIFAKSLIYQLFMILGV